VSRALAALAVLILLAFAPPTTAAPDPQVLADGAECFAALPAGGNGTCSVLYVHMYDKLSPMPLSVQALPAGASDLAEGFDTPGIDPLWEFSRAALYPAMGPLEYIDGKPRIMGRGPADLVHLVPGVPIIGYWYLSADSTESGLLGIGQGSGSAGAMPCLAVEMRVHASRFSDGPIIAHGKTVRSVVSMTGYNDTPLPIEDPCPGASGPIIASDVHEFKVILDPVQGAPTELDALSIVVLWYQVDPSGDSTEKDKAVQNSWEIRSGASLRPRIVIPVETAARFEDPALHEADGVVGFSFRPKSPWGSHEFIMDAFDRGENLHADIEPHALRYGITAPDGAAFTATTLEGPIMRYYVGHGMHDERVNITFLWRPADEIGISPGIYTMWVEVDNLQGTATARAEIEYTFAPAAMREGPAPSVALLVIFAVISALAITLRRRAL
jgi:hypothetical protein